jgi:hypothetical protein
MALISVVMPAYNAAAHIADAIGSVLSQSVTDFELLIVDDGSEDDTAAIIGRFSDARIRHIKKGRNTGLIDSLNEGMSVACGKFVARMDADDICLTRRFEVQLKTMEGLGAELCGSDVRTIGRKPHLVWGYPGSNEELRFRLLFCTAFAHPTIMGTRRAFSLFPYEADYVSAEDYRLWTRMAEAGVRMTNVPEVLLQYRRHDKQESSVKAELQRRQTERVAAEFRGSVLGEVGHDLNVLLQKVQGDCDEQTLDDAFKVIAEVAASQGRSASEVAFVYQLLARKAAPMGLFVSRVFERRRVELGIAARKDWMLLAQALMGLEREGHLYQRLKRWVS